MPPNATTSDDSDVPDDAIKFHQLSLSATYGLVDGFNTSSSSVRLIFDVTYNNAQLSTQALHQWMLTQTGIIIVVFETLLITGLSLFANLFSKSKNASPLTKFSVYVSELVRDTFKSLKNAYKAIRSLLQTLDASSHLNLIRMIVPIWIVLGLLSMLNRLWGHQLDDARKLIIQNNEKLLKRINEGEYDINQLTEYHHYIARQSQGARIQGFISKAYGSIIDGLYLYMGAAVVIVLTPLVFTMVVFFSIIFVLTCIATRLYEEYIKQQQSSCSEHRVNLAICAQELKALFISLENGEPQSPDAAQLLTEKIDELLQWRRTVRLELTPSSAGAILNGLKDGLAIYGAICALLYSAYTVTLMLSCSFPAVLIPVCAILGMLCLVGFSIYSYIKNASDSNHQRICDNAQNDKLLALCLDNNVNDVTNTITDSMDFNPSEASATPKYSEVCRSGFSAIGKAPKALEFTLSSLQEQGENGRYHDTPLMLLLNAPCTLVFIYALGFSAQREQFPVKSKKNNRHQFFTAQPCGEQPTLATLTIPPI